MPPIATKNKLDAGKLFKISRFKEMIKRTQPHKHEGYYELIFIREGEGFHQIEAESYPVTVPELYFLKPGQLHCWQFTAIPRGFVLLFKEDFFDPTGEAQLLDLIKNLGQVSRVSLPGEYDPAFLFEEMLREYENAQPYSLHIIYGDLRSLFSRILQLSHTQEKKQSAHDALHEKFLRLLPTHCPELHKVSEFAHLLNTSPQNLHAACRKYTAKSASAHIAAHLMLEARRYLLHTDMRINEIADMLRFNDASYFVKYFKKQEGITPLQFRERHFQ